MATFADLIDRNTTGNRCDVTPVFSDAEAFSQLVQTLGSRTSTIAFDRIAAIDALGFVLGSALAISCRKGLLLLRKEGKLPVPTDSITFRDYSGLEKSLEIRPDAIREGERVLLVDEWVETGAQIFAAIALLERRGAIVAGVASIQIDDAAACKLRDCGYPYVVASARE